MRIPYPYRNDDQDFLTIPALKTLCDKYGLPTDGNRIELITRIEGYANQNRANEISVLKELDSILKIGIKTCILRKIKPIDVDVPEIVMQRLIDLFGENPDHFLCSYNPGKDLTLNRYDIEFDEDDNINGIEFVYSIELLRRQNTFDNTGIQVFYPIHVYIDCKKGFVIARGKSISSLFYVLDGLEIKSQNKTSVEKVLKKAIGEVCDKLNICMEDSTTQKYCFKKTIFNMLNEYAKTPKAIRDKMDIVKTESKAYINDIFTKLGIWKTVTLLDDAKYDLEIFVEKYISITYPDKEIFITDRDAYPIKFAAEDNEFTKIQESSSAEEPLQRKKAFFDSKKAIYSDGLCDKICLCHKSEKEKYYGEKTFNVAIYLSVCDCVVKFNRFVREGDIQNVLSRIIQLYNIQE